ncbi:MAG: sigma-70 family RNA polymerase sigma factor [Clostridia bacterium]|nr:sigma-70 family RNA polymerase sigma factor [Clostridia bacterium]
MNRIFEEYVESYSEDLSRLCLSLCLNTQDAEDLFQDTWLKAIKNYSKYNSSYPFDKWLYSICVNTFKNTLKLGYNKNKAIFNTLEDKEFYINSIPDNSTLTPEAYLELRKIISDLPKKLRTVLILKSFKDYSLKEIAEMLNIPEGTVKSRLHNAKSIIKRRLGE